MDGYEIALQRIEECKRAGATELDLRGLELRELPENVGELTWLTYLNLGILEVEKSLYRYNFLITLPESMTRLLYLTKLDLSNNQLSTLPENVTRLEHLTSLDLSHNHLSTLPRSVTKLLLSLTSLDLSYNQLSTLPESVTRLLYLTKLNLSNNQLSTMPENVTRLEHLTSLNLSDNHLSTFPESLTELLHLTSLNLSGNRLRGLPENVTRLEHLTSLDLSNNQLSTLPESVTELIHLTSLDLSYNHLSTLPESMTRLVNLTSLNLGGNRLRSLPESMTRLVNLTSLNLGGNQLRSLSESITGLVNLTSLDLRSNQLRSLPESVTGLVNLTSLDLSYNRLSTLPESVTRLVNLTSLVLRSNQLRSLPESVTGLVNLTSLDLRYNELSTLPESVTGLVNLTSLDLRYNELSTLPKSVTRLINLTSLDLSYNQLRSLPESVTRLINLTSLVLSNNHLSTLPESVAGLINLTSLVLSNNHLSTLPESMTRLINLTSLDLRFNQLNILPESVTGLINLTSLNLGGNRLTTLPESMTRLVNLTSLVLRSNQLSTLPKSVTRLLHLTSLNLGSNQLSTLPESVTGLLHLTSLDLSGNRLSNLPESVTGLLHLTSLDLRSNQLSTLPYKIIRLPYLRTLDLRANSSLPIPPEFLQNPDHVQALFDYLRERRILLNEVKVLIVGEAGVGKTTLVSTLLGESVDIKQREPTPGIEVRDERIVVRDDRLSVQEREILVHYWDFGGQEIMHNTHRLFLTTRSCYLLVLDATQNEAANKVVEWLKTIHLYATDAPVILVINKWDKFRLRLNIRALEQHHPIAAVIETSCATQEGIDRLKAALQAELATLHHLNDEIPAKWMEVRHQVGVENRDYLNYEEFELICADHDVTAGTYNSVAELLHALGVLFTYSNDRTTKLTHVLNPNWVTGGIYPILNDPELLQGKGFVTDDDIERILLPGGYPLGKYPFILKMMFVFELAYELQPGRYLVPDLLPKAPPAYDWNDKGALRFVYQYDFVPPGLFSRFVVRLRDEVNPEQVWRTGVILHQFDKAYGRVMVDLDAKRIEIALSPSDHRDPRTLLDTLRDKFKQLHNEYPGLEVKELVPIGNTNAFVDYADLLYWAGRREFKQSSRFAGAYDVRELLNGISAKTPQYATSEKTGMENTGERRKRLVDILIREFPSPAELEDFLYFEGLETYLAQINFNMPSQDVYRMVVRTLERAGILPASGNSVLGILLEAVATKTSGHPNDVAFLRAWAGELAG